MGKELTKVIYKPDPNKTEEFTVIVNPEEFKKWKDGGEFLIADLYAMSQYADWFLLADTSIPLVDVVDSFSVFHSDQGSQGRLGQASKQQLENLFGTSKDVEVVEQILNKGKSQAGDAISTHTFSLNAAKGSAVIDSKGKGLNGI
ncbi:hypothetical protein D9758_004862 [Tetrapyrgos nigripes]|uniref:Ribosome maturation protein SDO1/SBDS N-terminal domain-containing protein n=1 Tax=Tetrapyrgos nigripes TaxID=182062 RepID=A0A8H5G5X6_9AGAR|nr:hypothetical protein D9758_004862 [Tetrapyrgos nigripes]